MKRLSKYFIFILSFFTIYRITFFLIHKSTNYDLISVITSLAHGIRYDLSALSYLLFPVFLFFLFQTFPNRKNLKIARDILEKSSYKIYDSLLHSPNNLPVEFEILLVSPAFEKIVGPFKENLKKLTDMIGQVKSATGKR